MHAQSTIFKQHQRRALLVFIAIAVSIIFSLTVYALQEEENMSFQLTSAAFENGQSIPMEYTCEGADISPTLQWSGAPDKTKSFVLIVDDPDAPDPKAPRMTWVHWVLVNIPAKTKELVEDVQPQNLPEGTIEGLNDWKRSGYGGPCPPIGRHRYFHKLYALDTVLEKLEEPTKAEVEEAMQGHVLAQATLIGTYQKGM